MDSSQAQFHPSARITAMCFTSLSVLISISLGIWTYLKRNTRVVRASQPFFLYIICLGMILVASSNYPRGVDLSVAPEEGCELACNFELWLFCMGWAISLSALQAKLHRINIIMTSAKQFKRVTITVWDTLKPISILVALVALILTLMTIYNPIQYELSENGEARCTLSRQMAYLIPLGIILLVLLVMVCIQAWKARDLASEYSESKYIFMMLMSMDLILFLAWPLVFGLRNYPNGIVVLLAVIDFLMVGNWQLFLFLPKIRVVRKEDSGTYVAPVRVTGLQDPETPIDCIPMTSGRPSTDGELILTTKNARELYHEICLLQQQLQDMGDRYSLVERENESLRKRLEACCGTEIENLDETTPKGDETADTADTVEHVMEPQEGHP